MRTVSSDDVTAERGKKNWEHVETVISHNLLTETVLSDVCASPPPPPTYTIYITTDTPIIFNPINSYGRLAVLIGRAI